MVVVALAIHLWAATLAWFSTYLGPRIGAEAAVTAVTAYQNDIRCDRTEYLDEVISQFGLYLLKCTQH